MTSVPKASFWSAGWLTRSRVQENVMKKSTTERTEKMSIVYLIPSASLPPPSVFFRGTTRRTMRNCPTKAHIKRNVDNAVLCSEEGDITPMSAE